jgi:hypothetical protein
VCCLQLRQLLAVAAVTGLAGHLCMESCHATLCVQEQKQEELAVGQVVALTARVVAASHFSGVGLGGD